MTLSDKILNSNVLIITIKFRKVSVPIPKSLRIFIIPVLPNIFEFRKKNYFILFLLFIVINMQKIMNFDQEFFKFKYKVISLEAFQGSHKKHLVSKAKSTCSKSKIGPFNPPTYFA